MTARSAPTLSLPSPPGSYSQSWMVNLCSQIVNALNNKVSSETTNDGLMLSSPSGKVYKVTVSDSGTLAAVLLRG